MFQTYVSSLFVNDKGGEMLSVYVLSLCVMFVTCYVKTLLCYVRILCCDMCICVSVFVYSDMCIFVYLCVSVCIF